MADQTEDQCPVCGGQYPQCGCDVVRSFVEDDKGHVVGVKFYVPHAAVADARREALEEVVKLEKLARRALAQARDNGWPQSEYMQGLAAAATELHHRIRALQDADTEGKR